MAARKGCKHKHTFFKVTNNRVSSVTPKRIDPTRTTALRQKFAMSMTRQLNLLKGDLIILIKDKDILGKRSLHHDYGQWTSNEAYSYASTQIEVTDPDLLEIIGNFQRFLPTDWVIKYESTPHITVRYGLHQLEDTPELVRAIVGGSGDIIVKFGKVSVFEIEKDGVKQEVLKVEVSSPDLKELNTRLGYLPNTQTYEYNPHLTIAYMKEGTTGLLTGDLPGVTGKIMKFTEVQYSNRDGQKVSISVMPVNNTSWMNEDHARQLELFKEWTENKLDQYLSGDVPRKRWGEFLLMAYKRGVLTAFDENHKKEAVLAQAKRDLVNSHQGRRIQFMRDMTLKGTSGGSVSLLMSRLTADLEGVTSALKTHMLRTFSDGTISQKDPKSIVGSLIHHVNVIGIQRLKLTAQTSVVRAFNEGKLDAYEAMGLKEVGVDVEWSYKNARVCSACKELAGVTMNIKDARGLLPLHIGCCCMWNSNPKS